MAQDSIAYGESLLADIRERNSKLEKQARKRAKRDEWKTTAVQIAGGLVKDIFQQRQENFANNEQLMANKLAIGKVEEEAESFNSIYQNALKYEGGLDAWKLNEVRKMARGKLQQDYTEGTYSKTDFDQLVNQVADGYYDTYSKEFDARLKANQDFLLEGNTKAFSKAIDSQKKSMGMSGTFLKTIGLDKITGRTDVDLLKANKYTQSADAQKIFQDTYNQTKDAGLSTFIAQNFSKGSRKELGAAAPEFDDDWTTVKTINGAGIETEKLVKTYTQVQRNGNIVTGAVTLDDYGYNTSSRGQVKDSIEFSTAAALLNQNNNIQAGMDALQTLAPEDSNLIDNFIKQNLKEREFYETDADYIEAAEIAKGTIASYVSQGGVSAASQGWGTAKDGRIVQLSLILDNMKSGNPQDLPVSGINNPFATMFKIDQLASQNKLRTGNEGISRIAADGVALYDHYHNLSDANRENIVSQFENMSFFKNPDLANTASRARANNTMFAVTTASKLGLNPRDYGGTKRMLQIIDANPDKFKEFLSGTSPAETIKGVKASTPESGVETTSLLMPKGKAKNKRGQWTSPQHKDYAEIEDTVEKIAELETKMADPSLATMSSASKNLKRRLTLAKASLQVLRNKYTENYGSLEA
jgi:hypothetical protein